jgi:SpoVK/Ycf46/Vps4 family AAA+-type ATPase
MLLLLLLSAAQVIIIAATNRLEDVDTAVIRRFDRRIEVQLPTVEDRLSMFEKNLTGIQVGHYCCCLLLLTAAADC